MCHYEFGAFQPGIIRDVLRTHPLAIVGDHLYENVYYEPLALGMGGSDVDRQRVEWMRSRLQTRARRDAAQVDLGQLALADASPTDLINAVAQLIAAELQADLVEMFEVLPSADAYQPVAAAGSQPVSVDRIEPINPSALASGTLRAGQPLIIGDWTQETRFRRSTAARAAGVTTSAIVAISAGEGERMYGFLSVHSREPRIFSEDEIVFVQGAAVSLAHAIGRRQSQEQFRALVEHAPDAIVRYDRDLRIIYVNPAVERVTGRPAESLLGKTSRETGVLDAFLPKWELILRDVVRSGREQVTEYSLSTPQGERFFQSRIVPEFSLGHGNLVESLLVVSRDITELQRALEEQRQLSQDLLESERKNEESLKRQITAQQEEIERLRRAAELPQLSQREGQILRLLARGMTNREIGRELQLSPGTVKNHVSHLLDKLNAVDRTAAAVLASEMGWTEVADKI
jgi:PAS domain S-box-containing protein